MKTRKSSSQKPIFRKGIPMAEEEKKEKKVRTNPITGQPLITTISSGCKTPILPIKYSGIVKPFYYPNSPLIARYSITCVLDPIKDKDFLHQIQTIEKNEGVATIIKKDGVKEKGSEETKHSGKFCIKFQTKESPPIYVDMQDGSEPQLIELEEEIARGENVMVVYDIMRYTKRNTATVEHGLNFKPTAIYYYPRSEVETETEEKE